MMIFSAILDTAISTLVSRTINQILSTNEFDINADAQIQAQTLEKFLNILSDNFKSDIEDIIHSANLQQDIRGLQSTIDQVLDAYRSCLWSKNNGFTLFSQMEMLERKMHSDMQQIVKEIINQDYSYDSKIREKPNFFRPAGFEDNWWQEKPSKLVKRESELELRLKAINLVRASAALSIVVHSTLANMDYELHLKILQIRAWGNHNLLNSLFNKLREGTQGLHMSASHYSYLMYGGEQYHNEGLLHDPISKQSNYVYDRRDSGMVHQLAYYVYDTLSYDAKPIYHAQIKPWFHCDFEFKKLDLISEDTCEDTILASKRGESVKHDLYQKYGKMSTAMVPFRYYLTRQVETNHYGQLVADWLETHAERFSNTYSYISSKQRKMKVLDDIRKQRAPNGYENVAEMIAEEATQIASYLDAVKFSEYMQQVKYLDEYGNPYRGLDSLYELIQTLQKIEDEVENLALDDTASIVHNPYMNTGRKLMSIADLDDEDTFGHQPCFDFYAPTNLLNNLEDSIGQLEKPIPRVYKGLSAEDREWLKYHTIGDIVGNAKLTNKQNQIFDGLIEEILIKSFTNIGTELITSSIKNAIKGDEAILDIPLEVPNDEYLIITQDTENFDFVSIAGKEILDGSINDFYNDQEIQKDIDILGMQMALDFSERNNWMIDKNEIMNVAKEFSSQLKDSMRDDYKNSIEAELRKNLNSKVRKFQKIDVKNAEKLFDNLTKKEIQAIRKASKIQTKARAGIQAKVLPRLGAAIIDLGYGTINNQGDIYTGLHDTGKELVKDVATDTFISEVAKFASKYSKPVGSAILKYGSKTLNVISMLLDSDELNPNEDFRHQPNTENNRVFINSNNAGGNFGFVNPINLRAQDRDNVINEINAPSNLENVFSDNCKWLLSFMTPNLTLEQQYWQEQQPRFEMNDSHNVYYGPASIDQNLLLLDFGIRLLSKYCKWPSFLSFKTKETNECPQPSMSLSQNNLECQPKIHLLETQRFFKSSSTVNLASPPKCSNVSINKHLLK